MLLNGSGIQNFWYAKAWYSIFWYSKIMVFQFSSIPDVRWLNLWYFKLYGILNLRISIFLHSKVLLLQFSGIPNAGITISGFRTRVFQVSGITKFRYGESWYSEFWYYKFTVFQIHGIVTFWYANC